MKKHKANSFTDRHLCFLCFIFVFLPQVQLQRTEWTSAGMKHYNYKSHPPGLGNDPAGTVRHHVVIHTKCCKPSEPDNIIFVLKCLKVPLVKGIVHLKMKILSIVHTIKDSGVLHPINFHCIHCMDRTDQWICEFWAGSFQWTCGSGSQIIPNY